MSASHAHTGENRYLAHHFVSMAQQISCAKLGMWLFLAQELLFFSGLFVAYACTRFLYPETFLAAHEFLDWKMGTFNTVVLLSSSLSMALAVRAAQLNQRKALSINLVITIACAIVFMIVKYFEYTHKFHLGLFPGKYYAGQGILGRPEVFFGIYYALTGMHGLHVIIGIGVLAWVWVKAQKGEVNSQNFVLVENVGLYWHLVDLIWIFLFPLLYLVK
jgi:cytochrome c oxidase subunit 3